jgi:hypothetical protein
MERRNAITTAAAASLTMLAGAAGIAVNSGILDASGDGNVGRISPVDTSIVTTAPPITLYVEDPAGAPAVTTAPQIQPTDAPPATTSAPSGYQGDDRDEREGGEHDEHESDEHEGAEDDD